MNALTATRALVGAAASLHLKGLTVAVRLSERRVAKARRVTDTHNQIKNRAMDALSVARDNLTLARSTERLTASEAAATRAAALAEGRELRRDFAV